MIKIPHETYATYETYEIKKEGKVRNCFCGLSHAVSYNCFLTVSYAKHLIIVGQHSLRDPHPLWII